MSNPMGTIYQSFNSRFHTNKEVGESFVYSSFLDDVAKTEHTAILGPRGSGKTTLLKMLTIPAMLSWRSPERNMILEKANFLAIYVPASITWSVNYRSFTFRPQESEAQKLISIALFRASILASIIRTLNFLKGADLSSDARLHNRFSELQAAIGPATYETLSERWGLADRLVTADGMLTAIHHRVRALQRKAMVVRDVRAKAQDVLADMPFVADDFLDDGVALADYIEMHTGRPLKIAFCFDEIEIVSDELAAKILRAPRSIDDRLLIKFSAAPYVPIAGRIRGSAIPTDRNDFTTVFLSSFATRSVRDFSERLFESISLRNGVNARMVDVFGSSEVEIEPRERSSKPYAQSGARAQRFRSLWDKDESFRTYLAHKQVAVTELDSDIESERAANIRKVIWPVIIRDEFLFGSKKDRLGKKGQRRLSSRPAVSDIYTGSSALISICEGNPRWLIGLMMPFIDDFANNPTQINRSSQKSSIRSMISSYFALISTIPSTTEKSQITSLVELVDRLGNIFRDGILGPRFNPEPVLSFSLDNSISKAMRDLVGTGINLGVFVTSARSVPGQNYRLGEIDGSRIRLSNLLAPYYSLPLAGGRTAKLSTLLASRQANGKEVLSDLFG